MIKLPVRVEQDTANSLVIRDSTNREVANFRPIHPSSHLTHCMWEDAQQIVRALNAEFAKQQKKEKEQAKA